MPLATIRHVLDRLELTLNETKTHIVDATKERFNFLGFEIRREQEGHALLHGRQFQQMRPPGPEARKTLADFLDPIGIEQGWRSSVFQVLGRKRVAIECEHHHVPAAMRRCRSVSRALVLGSGASAG